VSHPRAIDQLIAVWNDPPRAREFMSSHKFPLVDGSLVTFVWLGHADAVNLRHWIYGLESSTNLTRAPNTDIWHLTLEIPPNSRVEYKFEVHRHGHSEWIQDPLNKARARDPFGANSVLQGAGYVVPDWTLRDPYARRFTGSAPSSSTCPPASGARGGIRSSSSTTATTTSTTPT
jgi:enterochelin esterase family protein